MKAHHIQNILSFSLLKFSNCIKLTLRMQYLRKVVLVRAPAGFILMTGLSKAGVFSYCAMLWMILKDEKPMFDIYTTVHAKILSF